MKLVWAHFKAEALELLRQPGYLIPTMLFPAMFFWFFAAPSANNVYSANFLTASFAAFAVFGVVFFQFGANAAQDRILPWSTYLRTLPLSPGVRVAARVLSALVFAVATASIVVIVAHLTTPVAFPAGAWPRFVLGLLAGSVPMALLGVALGYWARPKAALPLANLVYLPLSFGGGFWIPPDFLPGVIAKLSPYLPTRQWGEVVWPAVTGGAWELAPWLWLAGYTLAFGGLAVWGYRRDEGARFS